MFALNFNCVKFLFEIRFSITKYVYGTCVMGKRFLVRERKRFPVLVLWPYSLYVKQCVESHFCKF